MITLAGSVWKTDVYETLDRLRDAGIDLPDTQLGSPQVVSYADRQKRQATISELWKLAQRQLCAGRMGGVADLQRKYYLRFKGDRERVEDGPAKLYGALTVKQAERALYSPGSLNKYGRTKNAHLAFKGRNWGDVLVMPFYDMPQRICALSFMGRRGNPKTDQVFYTTHTSAIEAGLGGLPSIELAHDPDTVIAVDDWLFYLRAQIRHFRSSYIPMPMVVWRDEGKIRTQRAWNAVSDKNIVFWGFNLDARMIRHAMETDGMISLLGPKEFVDDQSVGHFLRDHRGTDLPRDVIRAARPWRKALAHWLSCNRPEHGHNLFKALEELGEDVSHILNQIGKGPTTIARPVMRRSAEVGPYTISERGGCWYHDRYRTRPELIMDAVLRVTHAINDLRSGDLWYRGFIEYRGQRIYFLEPAKTMEGRTLFWIRDKVSAAGLGLLRYSSIWSRGGRHNLYQVAVTFDEPRFVNEDLALHVQEMREAGHLIDPI